MRLHCGGMQALSDKNRGLWLRALIVGVGLAVALMWTNIGGLSGGLVGFYNDDWANGIYLHHQVHAALLDGRLSLADPNQFFPFGYNPVHTNGGNILEMLVSGLFRLVAPWPLWLSLGALAWIPLNVLAFIPLGRRLWQHESAILAGAAAWALFPPVLNQLEAGRLTQVALVGVPLAIAGMLDLAERPGRSAVGLTAIGLALSGLGYWFNALFLGLLSPVFVIYGRRLRPMLAVGTDMIAAGALALCLVSPLLAVAFWPVLSGGDMPGTHIDPSSLPLVFPDALRLSGGQAPGLADWLPWVVIPAVALTLVRGRRVALWVSLGLLCVVFSMGPGQVVSGNVMPMPYWLPWKFVPGLSRMLHPDRWMLVGGLFITILAVDGMAARRPRLSWVIPVGIFAQLVGRGVLPLDVWTPTVPTHWETLAQESDQGAVIVLPLHGSQLVGQYQRVHGRSLLGGMVEDQPWAQPENWKAYEHASPLLSSLRAFSYGRPLEHSWTAEDVQLLRDEGFSWIVFDAAAWRNLPRRVSRAPQSTLTNVLGPPAFESQDGIIWSLAALPAK